MNLTRTSRLAAVAGSVLAGTLLLYGCKDFLTNNAVPQGTVDENTLKTKAGVEGALIAAYRSLDCNYQTTNDWGCAVSNWVFGSIASDDAYEGSSAGDQPGAEQIELYHWGAPDAEGYLNTKWTAVYDGVSRANATLRLLKEVEALGPTAISQSDVDGIRGEAIFLRAHYHFEAYRMWGSIPYYREDDLDYRKPNETKQAVEADLEKDLNDAIGLLPATPRNGQAGRATKWTAKAYLGRVQMYAGDFPGAVTTFKDVVANGPYALETSFDHVWTGFKQYENGKETIFAFQASANDGNGDGENSNYGERLNFPSAGSPFGCCGFHQPSQNLVNYFRVDPTTGLPLAITSPGTWNTNDANFNGSFNTTPVDPRLDWTVGRDQVPFKDWGLHGAGWVRSIEHGGFYSAKKNVHEAASGAQSNVGWTNTQLNSVNIHIFRYADLLLMLAEAEVETGDLAGATALVNQVRTRAAQMVQGCGVPSDSKAATAEITAYPTCGTDASIKPMAVPMGGPGVKVMPWATYQIGLYPTFPSQAYGRDAVRAERRLELAMEGQRFFDLRREGIADSALNGYVNGIGGGAEKNRLQQFTGADQLTSPKFNEYPIPDQQIKLSEVAGKPALTQNQGW